jgi:hypothetical protein
MYIFLNTKYPILSDLVRLIFSGLIFYKSSDTKFHGKMFKGAKLFHVDRQTIMMKLIAAFHNFENGPKIFGKR